MDEVIRFIEKYARLMHEDYLKSHESIVVKKRSELYSRLFKVAPIPSVKQEKPVVFVDAGRLDLETDVSALTVVNLGALVRRVDGELVTLNEYLGDPGVEAIETLVVYSTIQWDGLSHVYRVLIEPVAAGSLLFENRDPVSVSRDISDAVNNEVKASHIQVRKAPRVLKRVHSYIVGLAEVAYLARILSHMPEGIGVVDGSLLRWFTRGELARGGYRILSAVSGLNDPRLRETLTSIIGVSKTSKFTNVARAYNLFTGYAGSMDSSRGLYGYVDSESAERARGILDEIARLGVDLAREAAGVFNRKVFKEGNIWVFRIPVTGDMEWVLHADYYVEGPVATVEGDGKVYVNEDLAGRLSERIHRTIREVFAKRSSLQGHPPYGLMEVDVNVRIDKAKSENLRQLLLAGLKEATGRGNHPLIQALETTLRMRYGYG